jgi:hypothetical protein
VKKLAIILFNSLISANVMAEEENLCEPSQAAILYVPSSICHAENLGNNYKNMLSKATAKGTVYKSVGSMNACLQEDYARMDKRYAKKCPNLALLEADIKKAKEQETLAAELKKTNPDLVLVAQSQDRIVLEGKLADIAKEGVQEKKVKAEKVKDDTNDFYGFNWAPGLAVMNYDSPYIDDVRIESTGEGEDKVNTVYIDREVSTNIAIVLETHYLWSIGKVAERDTGWGFFAATNLVKQEGAPLSTFAFGPMFAVKDKDGPNGISVGLGFFVDTDFKVLRDDLTDGAITTFEDSAKVVRKVDETGWMLMISATF